MDSTFSSRRLSKIHDVVLIVVFVGFAAVTTMAVISHGYVGIVALAMQTWGGLQVFLDLVISLVLILVWMKHDAKETGRRLWPWVILTLGFGGFGPLAYLLTRKR